jgi:hypothetical protein
MNDKKWRYWDGEQCQHCGNDAEVLTDCDHGEACDGDEVRCVGCGCPGTVSCDDDDAWVLWHDERPGERDCWWCNSQAAQIMEKDERIAVLERALAIMYSHLRSRPVEKSYLTPGLDLKCPTPDECERAAMGERGGK